MIGLGRSSRTLATASAARIALLLVSFSLLPMLFIRGEFLPAYLFGLIVFPVTLLVFSSRSKAKNPLFDFNSVLAASGVYLFALILASTLSSESPGGALLELVPPALAILAFLVILGLLVSRGTICVWFLFKVLAPLVSLSAAMNIGAFLGTTPLLELGRLVPRFGSIPLGETIVSIIYAVVCVGTFSTLAVSPTSLWQKVMLSCAGTILLVATFMTQTRSAMLAIFVGLAILAVYLSRRGRPGLAIGLAASVLLLFLVPFIRDTVLLGRGSSHRVEVWSMYLDMALDMALDRPLGFGTLVRIDLPLANGAVIFHPHNLILSGGVRGGLIGAIGIIGILLSGTFWATRYLRHFGDPTILCVFATLITAGMFDYELVVTYPGWQWLAFWLPIGLGVGAEMAVRSREAGATGDKNPTGQGSG